MGVLRDRIHAKLRSRRGTKSVSDEEVEMTSTEYPQPPYITPLPRPPTSSIASSTRHKIPKIPPVPSSASSVVTRSTIRDTSTKLRRLLRTRRKSSVTSTHSAHLDDVPEPEPRLLPSSPLITPTVQDYPPDTPLTDGFVALTVPPAWRAVRADDAIYLLSGQGVGFVKAVRAVDACEVLLEVTRLSVMSQVNVRSSPVWDGCEARVEYHLVGGFGVGVARFQDGFDAGAVVFAVCAPNDKRKQVMDALESIRNTAKVVKVPENEEKDGGDGQGSLEKDTNHECSHTGKRQTGCVLQ